MKGALCVSELVDRYVMSEGVGKLSINETLKMLPLIHILGHPVSLFSATAEPPCGQKRRHFSEWSFALVLSASIGLGTVIVSFLATEIHAPTVKVI